MNGHRVIIAVGLLSGAFFMGFVFWYWLLPPLYAVIAVIGIIAVLIALLVATLRKQKADLSCAAILGVAGMLLAGWCVRAELREYAMLAESTRLIVAADAFKKREGRFARSARTLAPTAADDRVLAWIAGDSVRYGAFEEVYWISRGGAIIGEEFASNRRAWEVCKR